MVVKKSAPFGTPAKAQRGVVAAADPVRAAIDNAQSVLDEQRRSMNSARSIRQPARHSRLPKLNKPRPQTSSDLRNFLWGAGDAVLLGFGDELRDAAGLDPVDMDSNAYTAGDVLASAGMLATGIGGGIRAAGMARKGYEFSHFIPKRLIPKSLGA